MTALAITAGGNPVTTVNGGTVVTLTATVTAAGAPVTPGQIDFCEVAAPPLKCTDIRLLGTAQLTGSGTAMLRFVPGAGVHTYQAVFAGTHVEAASSSSPTVFTVVSTAKYLSLTTISASGSPGNYTLTAVITGEGGATVPPSGTLSFLDTTNANYPLATAMAAPTIDQLTFVNASNPAAGNGPDCIAIGDFDGDGLPDLVLGESAGSSLAPVYTAAILLGNGDGTFRSSPLIPLPYLPAWVQIADLNDDGKPDLIFGTIDSGQGHITVLLGNGDGTFAGLPPVAVPTATPNVATADFNGDGKADLVMGDPTSPNLSVLLGNGDGTFQPAILANEAGFPQQIVAADFNGDGIPDLAMGNSSAFSITRQENSLVTVLLGNGDGTFRQGAGVEAGLGVVHLATADFNGDGKADIATLNQYDQTVSILLGNGDGSFTTKATLPLPNANPFSVAVGDFNGDGIPDLAVAYPPFNASGITTITIYLGLGDGTFSSPKNIQLAAPSSSGGTSLAAADLNGDGRWDFVQIVESQLSASVWLSVATSSTATVTGVSPVGTGIHQVDASYPGDTTFSGSVSGTVPLQAEPVTTQLALTAAPSSALLGQPVVLAASIAPDPVQGYHATGSVSFYDGTTLLGAAALNASGQASYTTSTLAAGTHTLTATYAGDGTFLGSASGATAVTVIAPSFTALALAASPSSSAQGEPVALTASLTPDPAQGYRATGSVSFYDGLTLLGTAPLDASGQASYTTTALPLGTHTLTASYAGDSYFLGSTSGPVLVTVTPPNFTIALSSPSITLQTYRHTTTTVTLTAVGAFADVMTLACGNPPRYVTCIFTPQPATLAVGGTAAVSLYLDTDSIVGGDALSGPRLKVAGIASGSPLDAALLLLPVALFSAVRPRRARSRAVWLIAVAFSAMAALNGCGGNEIEAVPSAAPGAYVIPVTATGTKTGIAHTAILTLTVTP